jgi:hypothetical protein
MLDLDFARLWNHVAVSATSPSEALSIKLICGASGGGRTA